MSLTGDFAGLKGLEASLRRLASVPSRASRLAAEKIELLIEREYDTGTSSYGGEWAPLAPATIARGRHAPPLTDTRAMREGTHVRPMAGAGLSVTFGVSYAIYHHTGFRTGQTQVPARPVAPIGAGFPPSWGAAIKAASAEAVAQAMGSK